MSERVRKVTIASSETGMMAAGWVPASACDALHDRIDIGGQVYLVVSLHPSTMEERDNWLPLWGDAKKWEGK